MCCHRHVWVIAVSIGVQAACERWFQCLCARSLGAERDREGEKLRRLCKWREAGWGRLGGGIESTMNEATKRDIAPQLWNEGGRNVFRRGMNNEREEGETRGGELSTEVRRNKPPCLLPRNSRQATFDAISSPPLLHLSAVSCYPSLVFHISASASPTCPRPLRLARLYLLFDLLSFFSLLVSSPLLVCILSRLIDCVLIFHLTLSILCSLFSLIYFCFLLSDILLFFSIPPLFSCSVLVFFPLYFNFSISFVYPFHSLLFSLPSLIFPFLLLFLTLTISTPILTTISPCLFSIFSHPPFSPSCLLYASVLWPLCPYLSHFFFTVFYSLIISSSFHFLFQLLAFSLCPPALLTFSPFSSFHSRSKSLLSTPYFFLFPPAPSLTHNFSTISPLNARYQLLSLP